MPDPLVKPAASSQVVDHLDQKFSVPIFVLSIVFILLSAYFAIRGSGVWSAVFFCLAFLGVENGEERGDSDIPHP